MKGWFSRSPAFHLLAGFTDKQIFRKSEHYFESSLGKGGKVEFLIFPKASSKVFPIFFQGILPVSIYIATQPILHTSEASVTPWLRITSGAM